MTHHDLIVVGGGLIGSAIAWGASRAGADVVLLDERDIAFRAARGNFGLIWLQGKGIGAPVYMHWSLRAGRLWRRFAEELAAAAEVDIAWRQPGGLHFCFSEAELDWRRDVIEQTRAAGGDIAIEILDRPTLSDMLPGLGPDVVGASHSRLESHVNPLFLLRALQNAFRRNGGTYKPGFRVSEILPQTDGFAAVCGAGKVRGQRIVIAAGLGSARLAPQVGLNVPVAPERGQIVVTERVKPFFPYVGNGLRQTEEGSFLLGSSHEMSGFDDGTDVATAACLCHNAIRLFPKLADATIVRTWGALRVMTPDGLPIYEQSRRYPGAFAVTCHSGVTLASAHALDVAPALIECSLPEAVASFTSDRFNAQAN